MEVSQSRWRKFGLSSVFLALFLLVLHQHNYSNSGRRNSLLRDVSDSARRRLLLIQQGYDFNVRTATPTDYVRTAKDRYLMKSMNFFEDPKIKRVLAEHDDPRLYQMCVNSNQPGLDVYFRADKKDEGILDHGITVFSLDCRSVDSKDSSITGMIVAIDKSGNVINAVRSINNKMGQVEGISMYNTTTAILSGYHAGFLWNFITGELTQLPFAADTHSLVYSWNSDKYFGMYSDDLSIEGDYAYCSARGPSTLTKVDMKTNEKIWTLGGMESNFRIYDINGNLYPTTSRESKDNLLPWNHQHKFQHLGMGFFSLFDNNIGTNHEQLTKPCGTSSRNVILYVNEETMEAWEVFSRNVGDNSMSYGGTDPLPSANVLSTSYQDWVHPADPDHQYHVNVWEINMYTNEVDWRLAFKGLNPVDPANFRDPYPHYFYDPENPDGRVPTGWNIYTVDRAYPTAFALYLCKAGGGSILRFSPYNTIRTQEDAPGVTAIAKDGKLAAQKESMYQKALVNRPEEIEVPAAVGETFTFLMNNQWDNQWTQEVNMAALDICI